MPVRLSRFLFFPAILTVMMVGAGAARAEGSLNVKETLPLQASAAKVWKLIGNFDGLPDWVSNPPKVEIVFGKNNQPGAVRLISLPDGARILEELLEYSEKDRSYKYGIYKSPLPVKNYTSVLSVKDAGANCVVTWEGNFDPAGDLEPAKVCEIIRGIYTGGFAGLKEKFPGK